MFPRVALEYGQVSRAASTNAWAISRSRPGRLTLRRAWRNHSPPVPHKSTSASIAALAGDESSFSPPQPPSPQETGRPTGGEQLFGIGAVARHAGDGERDVQA